MAKKKESFKGILANMSKKKGKSVNYVQTTSFTNPMWRSNLIWRYEPKNGWGWNTEEDKSETTTTLTGSWKFPNSDERIDDLAFQVQCLTKEVKRLRKIIKKAIGEDDNAE